jgi:hypothetical protein
MEPASSSKEECADLIVRFFRQHREDWRRFVQDFVPMNSPPSVQALAKFFVIRSNQPFDMQAYMKAQAEFIKRSLDKSLPDQSPEERQKMVAAWLRDHAQGHRDQIILEQARTIEQCGSMVEPALAELLDGILPGR